jgi:AAHS family 4-hydroxybenzoate transporter-like MFS transporter
VLFRSVGAVVSGLLSSSLLPRFGWQSVFFVGGIAPIIIAIIVLVFLPESLSFLARRNGANDQQKIRKIVAKIAPALVSKEQVSFYSTGKNLPGVPVKHLFSDGRAVNTILLWVLFLLSFYMLWILLAWAPTMLKKSGASIQQYSMAYAFLNMGAVVATVTIGRMMDKFDKMDVLKIAYTLAFLSLIAFGYFSNSTFLVVATFSIITGLFVNGANSGLMGLSAVLYPSSIRATGVGWAYGVGKIGSLLAPAVGGYLIAQNWTVFRICSINAFSALLIAMVVVVLQKHQLASKQADSQSVMASASTEKETAADLSTP